MPVGMQITPKFAWQNAERRIFDYLATSLAGQDGVTAFLEEYSKLAPTTGEMWTFNISGGGDGQLVPQPFYQFNAEWKGFYLKRVKAQQAWGLLLGVLPISDGVLPGVVHVRFSGAPTIERAIMNANPDATSPAGEIRGWSITVPLTVNFVNSEPEIVGDSNDDRND